MWEDDETRLLTLHPDTWAAMLTNNELAVGYVAGLSFSLPLAPSRSLPHSLLPLSFNRSLARSRINLQQI